MDYGSLGKAVSYNHGFFFQDAWTIGRGITINAGLRVEKENIPAEPQLGLLGLAPSPTGGTVSELNVPINFGWEIRLLPMSVPPGTSSKDGKMKVFGFDYQLKRNLAFEARWDRRRLDYLIEDSALFTP